MVRPNKNSGTNNRIAITIVAVTFVVVLASCAHNDPGPIVVVGNTRYEGLEIETDEFRGVTFVSHKIESSKRAARPVVSGGAGICSSSFSFSGQSTYRCRVSLFPYIGYDNENKWILLNAIFSGENWMFLDQVYVLVGTERYETGRYPSYSEWIDRTVLSSGSVIELVTFRWSDPKVRAMINAVVNAPDDVPVRVRFSGERSIDFELDHDERQAWRTILEYFEQIDRIQVDR